MFNIFLAGANMVGIWTMCSARGNQLILPLLNRNPGWHNVAFSRVRFFCFATGVSIAGSVLFLVPCAGKAQPEPGGLDQGLPGTNMRAAAQPPALQAGVVIYELLTAQKRARMPGLLERMGPPPR